MAILNLSLFVIMVFENQLDLILQNALLSSRLQVATFQSTLLEILGPQQDWSDEKARELHRRVSQNGMDNYTLFREDGRVIMDVKNWEISKRDDASLDELKSINAAMARKAFENAAFSEIIEPESKLLDLWAPFNLASDSQGVVRLRTKLSEIGYLMEILYRQALFIGLALLLIHFVYAFLTFRQIFVPLRLLLMGTRAIASGQLDVHIPLLKRNEMGELAAAFNEMGVAVRNMKEEALGANPLTGLPGNHAIAHSIEERLQGEQKFAVLYCDLDNFKAYNDKYGFSKGDDAILYVRDCLSKLEKMFPNRNVFIGHEGGDDFVVIIDYVVAIDFCEAFLPLFDSAISQFYKPSDMSSGFIESVNRQGVAMIFPLMSISVAIVSNKFRPYKHYGELVQAAAEIKKLAKKVNGSSYVEDTRADRP